MKNSFERIKYYVNVNKNLIITFLIVVCLLVGMIFIILDMREEKKKLPDIKHTQETIEKDVFKGFKKINLNLDKTVKYDLESTHKFVYSNNSGDIVALNNNQLYTYEIKLVEGILELAEQEMTKKDDNYYSLEYTGNKYEIKLANEIVDYLVARTCDEAGYALYIRDKMGNVYLYVSDGELLDITDVIKSVSKVRTISKASKIGYYNLNNTPYITCNGYELIYVDKDDNIRYVEDNKLFFASAYYKFIGADYSDQLVYVLKDGRMKYSVGNINKYLKDNDEDIFYRGSFYTKTDETEDLYIISSKGYLYKITDMDFESRYNIERVSDERISLIGTQIMVDKNEFGTDYLKVKIQFDNKEIFDLSNVLGFEVLN